MGLFSLSSSVSSYGSSRLRRLPVLMVALSVDVGDLSTNAGGAGGMGAGRNTAGKQNSPGTRFAYATGYDIMSIADHPNGAYVPFIPRSSVSINETRSCRLRISWAAMSMPKRLMCRIATRGSR